MKEIMWKIKDRERKNFYSVSYFAVDRHYGMQRRKKNFFMCPQNTKSYCLHTVLLS